MKSASETFGAPGEGKLLTAASKASAASLHEGACLNCGTALVGPHCHACVQVAHIHWTAGAMLHDLAHGALHFEGHIWHTLPELALRPGQLTRRYIEGERTRFVSPMALFFFSIFLMFATFQILGFTSAPDVPPTIEAARQETPIGATPEALRADNPGRERTPQNRSSPVR